MHELLDCHVGITTRLNGHHSAFVPTRWSLRQIYISGSVFIAQEVRSTMAKVTQVAIKLVVLVTWRRDFLISAVTGPSAEMSNR